MATTTTWRRCLLAGLCAALGCGSGVQTTTHHIAGGPEARVAAVEQIIKKSGNLPGAIRQAELVEEQQGDGRLGPSDFKTFLRIEIDPGDAGKWKAALQPAEANKDFASPLEPVEWWLEEKEFAILELYEPKALFGRYNGWVGFSPDGKTVYVFTFTM
jgi:hypothetical protein